MIIQLNILKVHTNRKVKAPLLESEFYFYFLWNWNILRNQK